ncbi:hypothetical protein L6452_17832 [Arctium lappa]|uniref:Uncharacterized protein n=1 Tax=Arctium lappa TaxID=4217 RepID=A0ACB9C4P4_ARCLA|nr:hypothetical protein L6452_17832 [Arctium lappa]
MKDGVDDGQPDNQEERAKDLMHLIMGRIEKIKELKIDAESAIHMGLTDYPDEGGFNDLQIELNRLFKQSSASGERTPKSPMKRSFLSPCTDMVLSQQIDDPLAVLWESPTYVGKGKAKFFEEPSDTAAWVNETSASPIENAHPLRVMNTSLPQSTAEDDKEKVKLLDPKKEKCVKGDGEKEMQI